MIVFASNRTSWDEANSRNLPGSIADTMMAPITKHLDPNSYAIEREPREGALNLYSNGRSTYSLSPDNETSVLLSHGIADKGIRKAESSAYDYVIVPSRTHARRVDPRLERTGHHPILGYPKLDPLFNGEVDPLPRDDRIRVLYAPTHGGGSEVRHWDDTEPPTTKAARRTSWWRRDEVLNVLDPDTFDVVECPHPRYKADRTSTLREYLNADVVIADGGSTLWEAMILGIPLVIPRWITNGGHAASATLEARIYRMRVGRQASSPSLLPSLVMQAARRGPTEAEESWGQCALPHDLRGNSGKAHAEWITALAAE